MANLRTQFSEMRKHIPKHVQWLLLIAAFVVVIILLTLLLHKDTKPGTEKKTVDSIKAELDISPDSIDWTMTKVGDKQTQEITISSNVPVKISAVRLSKDVEGFAKPKTTCTNIGQITDKISCTISLEYNPTVAIDPSAISLFIDWRGASQPENLNISAKVVVALGAVNKEEKKAEPLPEPTPVAKNEIQESVETIAPSDNFIAPVPDAPSIVPEMPKPEKRGRSESCSDFAFPGYNNSGVQIGWIKPDRGGYKYHPFSDKECNSPTGAYNPDNGIITDINNPSKRIGTDADHIGFGAISNGKIPELSNPVTPRNVNRARQLETTELQPAGKSSRLSALNPSFIQKSDTSMLPSSFGTQATVSSRPYDRTFVLRQYKPIPATIVSEVRAVAGETRLPVTATVDRNVFSDDGRTIIVPAGTMMLGSVVGDMPGPYKSIGRISIEWYRFVRPDGVEFNFMGKRPFSGDAQGRTGVPGHGSTDYMEQFVMPMLTAVVPAAVNMIAPISDKFVNQIDLDNNTVTQTGQVKSSELAKNEIITAWNKVAQKLLVDMMDNTVPPFSIASGTRITVFSPTDLIVTCGDAENGNGKKCAITAASQDYAPTEERAVTVGKDEPNTLVGQVRSFDLGKYCSSDGKGTVTGSASDIQAAGLDYRTVVFYCQSTMYQAKNNAKQDAIYTNQQATSLTTKDKDGNTQKMTQGTQVYNEKVLGLEYKDDGTIKNPFQAETQPAVDAAATAAVCPDDGAAPDANGCCTNETYTDMGAAGFNCCPNAGGDCYPPLK